MEKYAWKAAIKDGCLEEYKKRHDNIWDEMKKVLSDAGIVNYSIWNVGNELFGYYECAKGLVSPQGFRTKAPWLKSGMSI